MTVPGQPGEPEPTPTTTGAPGTVEPGLEPFVSAARTLLAEHISVSESAITVVGAESVVWPDGALGCPRPGVEYPQVQVDGYRIVLTADGLRYAYHGGGGKGPFLCEK